MSKGTLVKTPFKALQVMVVFTIPEDGNEELLLQKLENLADTIQDTVDLNFEDDARDTYYVDAEQLTHLILRRMEDGEEKEQVARSYMLEYVGTKK